MNRVTRFYHHAPRSKEHTMPWQIFDIEFYGGPCDGWKFGMTGPTLDKFMDPYREGVNHHYMLDARAGNYRYVYKGYAKECAGK